MSILIDRITRSIVRPIITLGLLAVWVVFIFLDVTYPAKFEWLTIAAAAEWVSERALLRLIKGM